MKMPTDIIREEIQKSGAISFARFMELALYCPESGYYERNQDNVGRAGDFITSVSTGSLFGELLAFQFAGWLEELKTHDSKLKIIEAGAHDGKLAADILNWLKIHRPEICSEIEYLILEPSVIRQEWQRERLKHFSNVRWHSSLVTHPSSLAGIVFSNELLDAFPVRRFGWDARTKSWFEWGVGLVEAKFAWKALPVGNETKPSSIHDLPSSLLQVLPDGYIIEDSPAAESWWRTAAHSLQRGKLLAIDYGLTAEEQLSPTRTKGTLRAYHRHQVSDDLLARPGEQDLTAHVNFTAIQKTGAANGLSTEFFGGQPQFLTRILARAMREKSFAQLEPAQVRQFQTLTHPEHLGRAFRVLVQSRP